MSDMTVGELIAELQNFDEDRPVLLALQPSYPMIHHVADVSEHTYDTGRWEQGEEDDGSDSEEIKETAVFISETGSNDYGCPREIFG